MDKQTRMHARSNRDSSLARRGETGRRQSGVAGG